MILELTKNIGIFLIDNNVIVLFKDKFVKKKTSAHNYPSVTPNNIQVTLFTNGEDRYKSLLFQILPKNKFCTNSP